MDTPLVLNIMKISLTVKEQYIIKRLLSVQIEKSIGISPPQETYIRNIDSGMTTERAKLQFTRENKKYSTHMRLFKKDPLFRLMYKLSKS